MTRVISGTTRSISSAASTAGRFVTPDSPPMSISAAPSASSWRASATRESSERSRPASENESGVALTIPMISGATAGAAERATCRRWCAAASSARSCADHDPLRARLVGEARRLSGDSGAHPSRAPSRRVAATRRATSPRSQQHSRAASRPSRVRRSSTSPTDEACSATAANRASASRSGCPGDDRPRQRRVGGGQLQHLSRGEPVAAGERRVRLLGDPGDPRQVLGVGRRPERNLLGAARRLAPVAGDEPVDGKLGHPPPGRQLAAGDRDHPAGGLEQLLPAGDVDRAATVAAGDQRPDAGVGPGEIGAAQAHSRRTSLTAPSRYSTSCGDGCTCSISPS